MWKHRQADRLSEKAASHTGNLHTFPYADKFSVFLIPSDPVCLPTNNQNNVPQDRFLCGIRMCCSLWTAGFRWQTLPICQGTVRRRGTVATCTKYEMPGLFQSMRCIVRKSDGHRPCKQEWFLMLLPCHGRTAGSFIDRKTEMNEVDVSFNPGVLPVHRVV